MAVVPDRARQAFRILHVGFVVAPILAGLDKFFEVLVDWDRYLAPVVTDVLPVSGHSLMLAVGVIEIAAGVLVALRPRIGGYVVAVWLWADHRQPAGGRRLLRHRPARLRPLPRRPRPGKAGRGVPHRQRRHGRRHLPAGFVTGLADRRLRVAPPLGGVDLEAAERAALALLEALGADPADEDLADTPRRVAAAFAELLTPLPFIPTTFPNDEGYDELVVARSIPFHSLCQHHLLPFHGVAHVGYLPGERLLGLSKLARVVELFARGLQTQERLTGQVAGWLSASASTRAGSGWWSTPSTCA